MFLEFLKLTLSLYYFHIMVFNRRETPATWLVRLQVWLKENTDSMCMSLVIILMVRRSCCCLKIGKGFRACLERINSSYIGWLDILFYWISSSKLWHGICHSLGPWNVWKFAALINYLFYHWFSRGVMRVLLGWHITTCLWPSLLHIHASSIVIMMSNIVIIHLCVCLIEFRLYQCWATL